jgi:serine/threonine protein kinase
MSIGNIKIGDFGLAVTREDFPRTVRQACGTPEYMAAEVGHLHRHIIVESVQTNILAHIHGHL